MPTDLYWFQNKPLALTTQMLIQAVSIAFLQWKSVISIQMKMILDQQMELMKQMLDTLLLMD